ncbi:uncharacterized protein EV420DRAFT_1724249 [Desarmillaria tabescens]|uniref:Uncharacterized protein n=1 Tax=Armillaria tabescens TaxID=1929756 RepID=A0AA39MRJ2_ARMTA|nr:uncharacterized protein EV420DRAFT_1724249 [Desarmillaria tabescens]KAK0443389.1 hypothetical protein EV420DRAFT_1724249 [Desarmillaria tabescens]
MDLEEWLHHYIEDLYGPMSINRGMPVKYEGLPNVSLSPATEAGQELPNPVLKQQSYSGRMPVIPSALADTLCTDLTISGLLERFNAILGTSYTLHTPWVDSVLGDCISKNYDFGIAYAHLRPFWYDLDKGSPWDTKRMDYLHQRQVRHPKDACKINRVVPSSVGWQPLWGISHAWMDEEDREDVLTPINGYEWPVPIPKDTSLEHVQG